jgi:hypothetical protein
MAAIISLVVFLALVAGGWWFGLRGGRPPAPSDLRRADDAERQELPTPEQTREAIRRGWDETAPLQ